MELPSENERTEWWQVFYKGSSFRAFARVLLYGKFSPPLEFSHLHYIIVSEVLFQSGLKGCQIIAN